MAVLNFSQPSIERTSPSEGECAGPWFVAYTKPAQEVLARQQLQNQGFDTYLPLYRVHLKPRGARVHTPATVHHEPMFARYVFVRPKRPGQSISSARYTRGVSHLVAFGQALASVGEPVVAALRALEAQRDQLQTDALSPFQPGTLVRLRGPGLQGLQGVVVGSPRARVQVLLDILGAPRLATVAHEQLIAA